MKELKKLNLKERKERHTENPKDKTLHKEIGNKEVDQRIFNKLIQESTKHKPFDKGKRHLLKVRTFNS